MSKARVTSISLYVFAAIGAIAALTTIVDFARPSSADVQVAMHPNRFEIPKYIESTLSNGVAKNAAAAIEQYRLEECEIVGQNSKTKPSLCGELDAFKLGTEGIGQLSSSMGATMFELSVTNAGRAAAKGLRLQTKKDAIVDVFNEDDLRIDNVLDKSGRYSLPDLNPGDKLRIVVWSVLPSYSYENFYQFETVPRITFENGKVATTSWAHAPRLYSDIFSFLNAFHWIFQVIIVIFVCLLVTLLSIFIIGVVQAIVTGKSLDKIFQSENVESEPVS